MDINALELLIPLTYIPGVALLIMSTSQRYIHVNDIIHDFSPEECDVQSDRVKKELRKAHLFRNALIGLYMSTALFAMGSLVAFVTNTWGIATSTAILEATTVTGVACILFAVTNLVIESMLTLDILKHHTKRHMDKDND